MRPAIVKRKVKGVQNEYQRSTEFRILANAALARYNAQRPHLPKCGARRKRDGEPCQNVALANGRCRYHGGRTPSGDGWHKPVWPNGKAPDAEIRLYRKLQDLERAARRRVVRLRQMTEDERAEHKKWHKARPITSALRRAEAKRLKLAAKSSRKLLAGDTPRAALVDPEYLDILGRLADARARLAALRVDQMQSGQAGDGGNLTEGVFG